MVGELELLLVAGALFALWAHDKIRRLTNAYEKLKYSVGSSASDYRVSKLEQRQENALEEVRQKTSALAQSLENKAQVQELHELSKQLQELNARLYAIEEEWYAEEEPRVYEKKCEACGKIVQAESGYQLGARMTNHKRLECEAREDED